MGKKKMDLMDPTTGEVIADDIEMYLASAVRDGSLAAGQLDRIMRAAFAKGTVLLDSENCRTLIDIYEKVYRMFSVRKMECDERFRWKLKMHVEPRMGAIRERYRIILCWDPVEALRRMIAAIEAAEEAREKPELFGENAKKAEARRMEMLGNIQQLHDSHPQYAFGGIVQGHKVVEAGPKVLTELVVRISAGEANMVNEMREMLPAYGIRFEKIG